ncbi:MAG: MATE family efflux transporter [Myxococcales bacterium]|nr:MATE family efflux transporter [Myxococcales bacterium]
MKTLAKPTPAITNRALLGLAVPAMVALAAEPLFGIVDAAMIARVGTESLAALAVASTVIGMSVWVLNFLVFGTTSEVARLHGAGRDERIGAYLPQVMAVAIVLGVLLAAAQWLLCDEIYRLMGARPEVIAAGRNYYRIRVCGIPLVLLGFVGMGALRGLQNTRIPMIAGLGVSILNGLLDYALIFGVPGWIPAYGMEGAAWATLAGEVVWCAFLFGALWGLPAYRATRPRMPRFDPGELRAIFHVSRDLFLRTGSLLLTYTVATAVAGRVGTAALAGHEIALKMWMLGAFMLDGFAIAGQAVVAKELGAGRIENVRAASRTLVRWGVGVGVLLLALFGLGRGAWIGVFDPEPAVRAQVLAIAGWIIFSQPLNAVVFVLDGILMGANDLRFLRNAMFGAAGVFALFTGASWVFGWGLRGLWAGIIAEIVVRFGTNLWRFRGDAWIRAGGPPPEEAEIEAALAGDVAPMGVGER